MTKALVIGSNSFSGCNFVKHLLEMDYEVTGISRSPEVKQLYRPYSHGKNFNFKQLDLNKDPDEIRNLIKQEKFPYIINFASQSMVGESWQHPDHWYQTNTVGLVKLVDALKDMDFIDKYVHISTPEVYGSMTGRVREDHPFNPSTPYAASRAAGDTFLQLLKKHYDLPVVFTRAANVFGAGQQLFKIIPRAFVYAKKGITIPLHGGGIAQRSFIHIDDVSEGTRQIMEGASDGEIYHISTDELTTVRGLVERICKRTNVAFESAVDLHQVRQGMDQAYVLDSTKLKTHFNWEPKVGLEKGLDEVQNWIESNWEEIRNEPLEYQHKP